MKIAVAMSGGVDSTIAAIKLLEEGHEIVGVTARILPPFETEREDLCFTETSLDDARKTAHRFGFEHHTIDASRDFSREIIDPFCQDYLKGLTPNPCINCNPKIKFREMISFAQTHRCDAIATGHYARINHRDGRFYVTAGIFPRKDQSYFLYMLSQEVLKKTLFPLGEYTKDEIFQEARHLNLPVADKPESKEICFVKEKDYADFIEQWTGIVPHEGNIVNSQGEVLGRHTGIHRYTIGQRRGLGIAHSEPLYVTGINSETNEIIAGTWDEQYAQGLRAHEIYHMKSAELNHKDVLLKTRSTQPPIGASVKEHGDELLVSFKEPLIGVTAGQAAVFYDNEMNVLGGGIITESLHENGLTVMV
jgi:tRNA-uridine 2-sulfurtransferase